MARPGQARDEEGSSRAQKGAGSGMVDAQYRRLSRRMDAMHVLHNNNDTSMSSVSPVNVSVRRSTITHVAPDPCHFKKVVVHEHWVKSMNQELTALELNETWEIVPLPPEKHAIGSKWIFKIKFLPDGSVDKHKARLVVLRCHQRPGEDYFETFAHVAKITTVQTLLTVAAMQ
ncbi:putative mitochondrial protein AtMg00820 [Apium graveolens]|uniref:putative mitochondrial protein AtMg00820 n=1 Tax=Apium graveolens TaxID=4045 RepID=UPI003D7B6BA4